MVTSARVLCGLFMLGALLGTGGCMTKQQAASMRTGQGEALPVITVEPGVAERLALMDEYRLHDETRKLMMRRPHVTIEELAPDEEWESDAGPTAAEER